MTGHIFKSLDGVVVLDVSSPPKEQAAEIINSLMRLLGGNGPDALSSIKITEHRSPETGVMRTVIDVSFKIQPEILEARIKGLETAVSDMEREVAGGKELIQFLRNQQAAMEQAGPESGV